MHLIQLQQIAAEYDSPQHFLTELTLDPPDATTDQDGVHQLDEGYGTGKGGSAFDLLRRFFTQN